MASGCKIRIIGYGSMHPAAHLDESVLIQMMTTHDDDLK
jgi:hypothetical protein